ncbi:SigE family RNA polymerase sigma factor [Sinosporangium siamense]|uniref:DNA-directed RNA polymerase sigma-70 factor n=1 Tax=Sinosporangium siamense TaxID=1367973 RepID=A0A919VAB1_9ACTN|nr:SigE family RNA polymerase sigma factor [Sinosporangium siamense]GII90934.1 DNA-directed RNA polymerase sigma-70 factor [Sinosporangium siamense]
MPDHDFESFVQSAGARLLRFAVLVSGDRSKAEDLVQDALVKVYPRWNRIRDNAPEAYVRRTIINQMASWWRSPWVARRAPEMPDPPVKRDAMGESDERARILAALRRLPTRMRTVVVMRYWLGYSEMETARELGCSPGTVKSQASRGLERLRGLLTDAPRPAETCATSPSRESA